MTSGAIEGVFVSRIWALVAFGLAWGSALCANAAPVSERQIIELVRDAATMRLQLPRQDVDVEWADIAAANLLPTLPEGRVTLEVAKGVNLAGRGHVAIQVFIDGQRYRTIFPKLSVKLYQNALVATRRLEAGQLLTEADVRSIRDVVKQTADMENCKLEQVVGLELQKAVPMGTRLTPKLFRLARMVKAGDALTVLVTSGDLTVIAQGIARTDGVMGQLIKVSNPESKVEFMARVVAPNRVSVDLEGSQ